MFFIMNLYIYVAYLNTEEYYYDGLTYEERCYIEIENGPNTMQEQL